MTSRGSEIIYFLASSQFLGDQRPSYNHNLKFTLRLGETRGYPSSQDIIIEGALSSLTMNIYGQNNPEPSDQVGTTVLYSVSLANLNIYCDCQIVCDKKLPYKSSGHNFSRSRLKSSPSNFMKIPTTDGHLHFPISSLCRSFRT